MKEITLQQAEKVTGGIAPFAILAIAIALDMIFDLGITCSGNSDNLSCGG